MKLKLLPAILLAAALAAQAPKSISILPFANDGMNPEADWLSNSLMDGLAIRLQGGSGLTVVERAKVAALLDEMELALSGLVPEVFAKRYGALLGADMIALGAYMKVGSFLELRLRLVDASTGALVWVGERRGRPEERDAMLAQLAGGLSRVLGIELKEDRALRARLEQRSALDDAFLAASKGLHAEALDALKPILEASPYWEDALMLRAELREALGDPFGAASDYGTLIALNRDDGRWPERRGKIWYEAGLYEKAIQDLSVAIELGADGPWLRLQRGVAYREGRKDYRRSLADFELGIGMYEGIAALHNEASRTLSLLGRHAEAVEAAARAVALEPGDPWHRRASALALLLAGRGKEAAEAAGAAIALSGAGIDDPSVTWAMALRADAYLSIGDAKAARADLEALARAGDEQARKKLEGLGSPR